MNTSNDINELATALAKAQGAIEGARKDSDNPHYKSKYADLASVWDACRSELSSNGLAIVQTPGNVGDGFVDITTRLVHSSGQWIQDVLSVPLGKIDAHGLGSAITYGRRFSLAAMVGVAPEDDDGNSAVSANDRSGTTNDRRRPSAQGRPGTSEGNGRAKPEPLTGPIKTRAEARVRYGEIVRELHACEDDDALVAFLASIKAETDQFERELPLAWEGDGMELIGLKEEIARRSAALVPA